MEMNFQIEKLELEELKAFLHLQSDAFPDFKSDKRLNMLAEKWLANAEFSVCRDDNRTIIGMIIFYANRPEEGEVYIPHVYVRAEYRRRRVFYSMLQLIDIYVRECGFRTIRLEVKKNNEIAMIAYSHYGFIPMEYESDSYYMQKSLVSR